MHQINHSPTEKQNESCKFQVFHGLISEQPGSGPPQCFGPTSGYCRISHYIISINASFPNAHCSRATSFISCKENPPAQQPQQP